MKKILTGSSLLRRPLANVGATCFRGLTTIGPYWIGSTFDFSDFVDDWDLDDFVRRGLRFDVLLNSSVDILLLSTDWIRSPCCRATSLAWLAKATAVGTPRDVVNSSSDKTGNDDVGLTTVLITF